MTDDEHVNFYADLAEYYRAECERWRSMVFKGIAAFDGKCTTEREAAYFTVLRDQLGRKPDGTQ